MSRDATRRAVTDLPPGVSRVDYADCFELPCDPTDSRTPEQWARAGLDGVPNRALGQLAHRWLLGFALGPAGSPGHVFGWPIASSSPDLLHLRATGRLFTGHMVWQRLPDRVRCTTSLEFHHPTSRSIWAVLGHVHRSAVPGVLKRASIGSAA